MIPEGINEYAGELRNGMKFAEAAEEDISNSDNEVLNRRESFNSIVVDSDIEADNAVRSLIEETYPEDGIRSEEGKTIEGERLWVVDPLDGSSNFENGGEYWSTSIALVEDGNPVLGIVHSPDEALGITYVGVEDQGAYKTEAEDFRKIETNERNIEGSIVLTKQADYYEGELERELDLNKSLIREHNANIRIYNSGALELCKVAEGVASGFISHIESPWDFSAGQVIIDEAGGNFQVADTHKNEDGWDENREIIATNGKPRVTETLRELAENYLR